MNKRIKLLVEKAGFLNKEEESIEYLAQLLIKECAKIAYQYSNDTANNEHYDDVGWDCLPGDLEDHIKEHFGVE